MQSTVNQWRLVGQFTLGLALSALFLYTMAPFLIPLVIGAVIAILCEPSYRRLRTFMPSVPAGLSVTTGVTVLILAPITFVGINVAFRVMDLLRGIKMPHFADLQTLSEHPSVIRLIRKIPGWIPMDRDWLQEQGLSVVQTVVEKASAMVGVFIGQVPGILLGFAIVIVASYFFIVDGVRFTQFLSSISPWPAEKSQALFDAFAGTCRGVVLSMVAGAAIQGALVALFFAITGIPNPLLWGFIGIILGMVPLLGTTPIVIGGIFYHFANHNLGYATVIIISGVLIGFSDNIVRPWVLKGHGEMHPLLGLVSAFGAVSVLGPMGIIIGPVIAAVFVAFLEQLSADLKPQFHTETGPVPPSGTISP
jgi:predicted PurR-regulated permease PerM